MSLTMTTGTEVGHDPDSPWAVEIHGLTKRFGDNIAVNGVDLQVPRGVPSATSDRTVPARPPSSGCCSD